MREITQADIVCAARALLCAPEQDWPDTVAAMLAEAHHADRYRKAFGRVHPRLGTGSLMNVACARGQAGDVPISDEACLRAMHAVIEAVLDWRGARAPFR
ncbi:MAG: DUF7742 family protein [Roseinatronobacter sp.]